MLSKIFLLAASAAVAIATAPTTQCTNSCNPIALPSLGEVVPVSTPFTITWTPTTPGTVSIQLLQGPSTNVVPLGPQLVSGLANTGTYSWTPAASLAPSGTSGYGLQIINDADGTFQYSVQFGISNPNYGSSSASASVSASVSSASSWASGSATVGPAKNATSAYTPTSKGFVASTGYPVSNASIISPSASMTVPSTLVSAAASSTIANLASSTTASTTAKASSGAAALGMSMGGAVIALAGAVFAL